MKPTGLVLLDMSEAESEALEISGHDICRLFRFRPRKDDPCLISGLRLSGEFFPEPPELLVRFQIQFHLVEPGALVRFLCLAALSVLDFPTPTPLPFPEDSKEPNGVKSYKSTAEDP